MIDFNRLIESWDEAKACKSRIVHVAAIQFIDSVCSHFLRGQRPTITQFLLLLLLGKAAFPFATADEVC